MCLYLDLISSSAVTLILPPPYGAGSTMDSVHTNSEQEAKPEGIPDGAVSDGTGNPVSPDLQTFQTASESSDTSSDLEDPYKPGDGIRFQDMKVKKRK